MTSSIVDEANQQSSTDVERHAARREVLVPVYKEELKRQLSLFDVTSVMYSEDGAWISALNTLTIPFYNGGFSSTIYGIFVLSPVILLLTGCISELMSTFPTAGGPYHYVAMLAPKKHARWLSFVCGWLSLFFYITGGTSCMLSFAQQLAQIVAYSDPTSEPLSRWAQVATAWALLVFSFGIASFRVRLITYLTKFLLYFTLMVFVVINVLLLVKTPNKNSAKMVFATVTVESGWQSRPWSWVIGSSYVWYCFAALDCATHLVEDMKEPKKDAPRATFIGVGVNGFCTVVIVIVLGFCTDLNSAITLAPNFPIIAILHRSTGNLGAAVFLCSVCYLTLMVAGCGMVLITSRVLYSLGRDGAVPFSRLMGHVNENTQTPINAAIISTISIGILCLIYVGNTTAFFAISNTTTVFAYTSFLIPVFLVIICGRDKLSTRAYDMGKYGIAAYYISFIVGSFYCVVLCFPIYLPATPENMNYSAVVLAFGVLLLIGLWFGHGRHHYQGPTIELDGVEVAETATPVAKQIVTLSTLLKESSEKSSR